MASGVDIVRASPLAWLERRRGAVDEQVLASRIMAVGCSHRYCCGALVLFTGSAKGVSGAQA